MRTKPYVNEITIAFTLIVLLILCLNPLDVFMPSRIVMILLVAIVILFSVFAALLWREKPRDERESLHRMVASRIGFLTGSTILLIAIVFQEFHHESDPWLTIALVGMIIGKMIGFLYGEKKF